MRSRDARFSLSLLACLAIGGAGLFLTHTERQMSTRIDAVAQFDLHARDAAASMAAARAAQQAYVAAGQASTFWMPKVAALLTATTEAIDTLRGLASDDVARRALLEASAATTGFSNFDKRARDYLAADQPLMAGDVVFAEGSDAASEIARQIESARVAEHQALDADQAGARRLEEYAGGGAAGFAALVLLFLGSSGLNRGRADSTHDAGGLQIDAKGTEGSLSLEAAAVVSRAPPALTDDAPDRATLALNAAADICTALGCAQDLAGVERVLSHASNVLDASGLVVWLGSSTGADLRPIVAHGYGKQVLALMHAVPKLADNAAAAAYRTGTLQIVPAKPGTSLGAVVAPILSADGCIGALTAEIRNNGEVSDTVHAVAAIVAAQLASVLASSATQSAAEPAAQRVRTASA